MCLRARQSSIGVAKRYRSRVITWPGRPVVASPLSLATMSSLIGSASPSRPVPGHGPELFGAHVHGRCVSRSAERPSTPGRPPRSPRLYSAGWCGWSRSAATRCGQSHHALYPLVEPRLFPANARPGHALVIKSDGRFSSLNYQPKTRVTRGGPQYPSSPAQDIYGEGL